VNNTVKLIIAIAVPQLVAILSGLASAAGTREWYPQLAKPSFTPPSWVFGPVWTLLYLMMGIAAFLVWKRGLEKPGVRFALMVFLIHLAVNGAWSILFFGMQLPGIAFAEIVLLWCAIGFTVFLFFRQSATAGALLVPYWGWVSFASVLNFYIWRLNV
jgi:tryptophan-rich sensory protein